VPQSLGLVACSDPIHWLKKASLYTKVLSQILVWRLFASFSGAAMVPAEDDGGRGFGEAQVSSRVDL
jgi:hypothetical protein